MMNAFPFRQHCQICCQLLLLRWGMGQAFGENLFLTSAEQYGILYIAKCYMLLCIDKNGAEWKPLRRSKTMPRIALICGIAISIVSAGVSFMLGGLFGLFIWLCLFVIVAVEVIYHLGAKGLSDVPDARIEATTHSPRGWYDLDYRGRGRN